MKKVLLFLLIWFNFSCGNTGGNSGAVSAIEFTPSVATVTGTICQSNAKLISVSSSLTTVINLAVTFSNAIHEEAHFSLDTNEILNLSGSIVVPAGGILEIPLSFDLGTIMLPVDGAVIVTGSENGGVGEFVGTFRCQS